MTFSQDTCREEGISRTEEMNHRTRLRLSVFLWLWMLREPGLCRGFSGEDRLRHRTLITLDKRRFSLV
jgi:hypothetical protein